jgi:hypothetical protein
MARYELRVGCRTAFDELNSRSSPGVATLASKTSEGMASDARRYMVRSNLSKEWLQMRVRQPRLLGENNVLLPYPRMPLLIAQSAAASLSGGGKQLALALLPEDEEDSPGRGEQSPDGGRGDT